MKSLSAEHLAFLNRYGFDPELFAEWRAAVAKKRMSAAANKVRGRIGAPAPEQIVDPPRSGTPEHAELEQLGRDAIARGELGVVVLNGGMATRFGGVVKGVVEVARGQSFLELRVRDVHRVAKQCGGSIPLFLMNSFATDAATREHFAEHGDFGYPAGDIEFFTQFISVRMTERGDVFETDSGGISPYGPGHGDFAPALRQSGCLQRFLDRGGRHLLLGNVDNLGARVSPLLLGLHVARRAECTVEVAPKWPGDVGGAPYVLDGKLQLIEQIRYPDGFDPDIVDVFNTNTFWFDARALDRDFDLGWYFVQKTVEGRKAVQIERLCGELTRFLRSVFVRVKRTGRGTRFMPIKTPEDLESAREEIAGMYST